MKESEAVRILRDLLDVANLNDLQEAIFRCSWQGLSYPQMSTELGYDAGYIRVVGFQLWQALSDALGQPVTKKNLHSRFEQYAQQRATTLSQLTTSAALADVKEACHQDWGDRPDLSTFYGRQSELTRLQDWIQRDRCRLVGIFGIGGIGKTAIATQCAEQLQHDFQYVLWQSLRNAPPPNQFVVEAIQFLSDQQAIEQNLPLDVGGRIDHLLGYLNAQRCLIILDNAEAILQSGEYAGRYRPGYEAYGNLLQQVSEQRHQSCVVLTSREKPREFVRLAGEQLPVRALQLAGLPTAEGQAVMEEAGSFSASPVVWQRLVDLYVGNPLALRIAGAAIQELFAGEVARFLDYSVYVFDDINDLLDEQFNRLSELEQQVMYWLAIEREPVTIETLAANILESVAKRDLMEALKSLVRRSLIYPAAMGFTQQPVVMEYLVERLRVQMQQEIVSQSPNLLISHALVKNQAKEYVKTSQQRVLVDPLGRALLDELGSLAALADQLQQLTDLLRSGWADRAGYAAGNILYLLQQCGLELQNYDLSQLPLRQVDLQMTALPGVNLQGALLDKTVFANNLDYYASVAISPNQQFIAVGGTEGDIVLWDFPEMKSHQVLRGHVHWTVWLTFSPDGQLLASAGFDHMIKIWDVETHQCVVTLHGHEVPIGAAVFSPDGRQLFSGGHDGQIKVWETDTWACQQTIQTDRGQAIALAISPDGNTLVSGHGTGHIELRDLATGEVVASTAHHDAFVWGMDYSAAAQKVFTGSHDQTIRAWDPQSAECLGTFGGHRGEVPRVACTPDGKILASASHDQTIRLWDTETGRCINVLQGHQGNVWDVAISPDGELLASVSFDRSVRLWEVKTGRLLKTVQGSYTALWQVAFTPDGQTLISAGEDRQLWFWDLEQQTYTRHWSAHTSEITALAVHPQGTLVATGSGDRTLKLWDMTTRQCLHTLTDYPAWIWTTAFSPDGRWVASTGHRYSTCVWNVYTGQCVATLDGHHQNLVWGLAFSHDSQYMVTGCHDLTLKLWNVETWDCFATLSEPIKGYISCVDCSPNSHLIVCGGYDAQVYIWDAEAQTCLHVLPGHQGVIWNVKFSPTGDRIASTSFDGTVRVWDVQTGECLQTLAGHQSFVNSACFHPHDNTLVSASRDGTLKVWDLATGNCTATLSPPKMYEGLNITGVRGLDPVQREMLLSLGAIEHSTKP
ncbi:MAG: NB-ARC domain-containing protein [Cyanobacteria bacterium P01_D01_bin.115]